MLLSPEANLLKGTIDMIKAAVPEIRFISQDIGQLENYEIRPSVSWPCCLIDIEDGRFSNSGDQLIQLAEKVISFRLGFVKYSDVNNLAPDAIVEQALQYLEIENKLYAKLHGKAVAGFSRFIRILDATEKRDDDIRVRIVKFSISYTDSSAIPVRTKVPRPNSIINESIN
jgi:hypothetical protein